MGDSPAARALLTTGNGIVKHHRYRGKTTGGVMAENMPRCYVFIGRMLTPNLAMAQNYWPPNFIGSHHWIYDMFETNQFIAWIPIVFDCWMLKSNPKNLARTLPLLVAWWISMVDFSIHILVLKLLKMAIEIVDLPIKSCDFPYFWDSLP
jgi:hypothetical protein